MKNKILFIIKIIIVIIISSAVSSGIRVLDGIIKGEHGAPDFVTFGFQCFAFVTQILLVSSFILLEKYMPFKNKFIKGIVFIILFWTSDYISQILGMSGANSPILSSDALSFNTIMTDSAGYLVSGIVMGLLLSSDGYKAKKRSIKTLLTASVVSMIVFPCLLFILELFAGAVNPELTCAAAFEILKEDRISFYIVFYLFQAFSGFIFPIFYYLTLYNSDKKYNWLRFAGVYGFMLWTPVVLIVMFFGVAVSVTVVYAIIMLISVFIDTYIFAKLIEKKSVNP